MFPSQKGSIKQIKLTPKTLLEQVKFLKFQSVQWDTALSFINVTMSFIQALPILNLI